MKEFPNRPFNENYIQIWDNGIPNYYYIRPPENKGRGWPVGTKKVKEKE